MVNAFLEIFAVYSDNKLKRVKHSGQNQKLFNVKAAASRVHLVASGIEKTCLKKLSLEQLQLSLLLALF